FLQFFELRFRPIVAFFLVDIGSRRVVHVGVTREPSSTWVAQQLRNATPFGVGPRFIIRDVTVQRGALAGTGAVAGGWTQARRFSVRAAASSGLGEVRRSASRGGSARA